MHQKVISDLETASTSSEFASAVNNIPREEKYYNQQIRDLILQKKDLITDSPTADAVVEFFDKFTDYVTPRKFLGTEEIHDLVINILAPKISATGNATFHFGSMLYYITYKERSFSQLYATTASFAAILSCLRRAQNEKGALQIVTALCRIFGFHPSSNKLLNEIPNVVETFASILPHAVNKLDASESVIDFLAHALFGNETLQNMLATDEWIGNVKRLMGSVGHSSNAATNGKNVLDALILIVDQKHQIENSLRASSSSNSFATSIGVFLSNNQKQIVIAWPNILKIFLTKKHLIQDEESTVAATNFIKWFGEKSHSTDMKLVTESEEVFQLFDQILFPTAIKTKSKKAIAAIYEALSPMFYFSSTSREYFSTTTFVSIVTSSLPLAGESCLFCLSWLLYENEKCKSVFVTSDFKKEFVSSYTGHVSTIFKGMLKL